MNSQQVDQKKPSSDSKKQKEVAESKQFGREVLKTTKTKREPSDYGWDGISDLGKEKEAKKP